MPATLPRACPAFGCPNTQPCATHDRVRQWEQRRGSASSRGYGSRWRRYTDWFRGALTRNQVAVLCGARLPPTPPTRDSRCAAEGLIVLGTVVDHIVPITGPDDPHFYDPRNHQLLCERCHNAKRQREAQVGRR